MNERLARQIVRARSGGRCEVRVPGVCQGRATNWHHRRNRSAGGRWVPSNGLDLCGTGTTGCHGYITEHPAESAENGWTVRSWNDPVHVPALIHTTSFVHALVLLDDDGCFTPYHPPPTDE